MTVSLGFVGRVYIAMTQETVDTDLIRLIKQGRQHGDVIIGLLSDRLLYGQRVPLTVWAQRREILENIVGVSRVVPQDEWTCAPNLRVHRPDVLLHSGHWDEVPGRRVRDEVLAALASYGGRLVEVPTGADVSASRLRVSGLQRVLESQPLVRVIEAHSPLSAVVAQAASVNVDGVERSFDALWASSLTHARQAGLPDTGVASMQQRLDVVQSILDTVSLPLIFDADTGGTAQELARTVRRLEAIGVSAAIVEDKTGPKRNSLYGTSVAQQQEDAEVFAEKIACAASAVRNPDFMVIARVESLILGKGSDDALVRANAYAKAGAHAVMIHSRSPQPDEVLEFARRFRPDHPHLPLVAVPTTYCAVTEAELVDTGFSVVIYANHLLRAAYPAMQRAARSILANGRAAESESDLTPIPEFLRLFEAAAE